MGKVNTRKRPKGNAGAEWAFTGWSDAETVALAKARQSYPNMPAADLASMLNKSSQGPLAKRSKRAILAGVWLHDGQLAHGIEVTAEHGISAECLHGYVYCVYSAKLFHWVSVNGENWTAFGMRPFPGCYPDVLDQLEHRTADDVRPHPCRRSLKAIFEACGSRFAVKRLFV